MKREKRLRIEWEYTLSNTKELYEKFNFQELHDYIVRAHAATCMREVYAIKSMWNLCLVQEPSISPYFGPSIIIGPSECKKLISLEFKPLENSPGEKERASLKECPASDALPILVDFLERLKAEIARPLGREV